MAGPKGETTKPCHYCGRPPVKGVGNYYITRKEGNYIVWYAICSECKLKEIHNA